MLFNSWAFILFFAVVLSLYYNLAHRNQNRMLLVASYFFYGCWDWRFLSLIFFSTLTDYYCGIKIFNENEVKKKKKFLFLSIAVNLTLLGFFKYWNFFVENLIITLGKIGIHADIATLHIILPVGISFYTFQTMTYTIDIYRREIVPTDNFLDFALFVAFFPQLVAGPIERANSLLPQIEFPRYFKKGQIIDGFQLIFWGLFKKVFVADNLGRIVDQIYGNANATGIEYVIATWAFAFQIYGDFSGYSDVARGTAKCLGINLMHNFRQPYFVVNPSDFWRHWHISLSTWLRDYLYIPLGGNRKGRFKTYKNLSITMLLGGLWHGAAWNFIIWGAYHGLLLIFHRIFIQTLNFTSTFRDSLLLIFMKAFFMFQITCLGWIFFRSQNLDQIVQILSQIINFSSYSIEHFHFFNQMLFFSSPVILVMGFQSIKERQPQLFEAFNLNLNLPLHFRNYTKSAFYGILAYLLCLYGAKSKAFIYFQF